MIQATGCTDVMISNVRMVNNTAGGIPPMIMNIAGGLLTIDSSIFYSNAAQVLSGISGGSCEYRRRKYEVLY